MNGLKHAAYSWEVFRNRQLAILGYEPNLRDPAMLQLNNRSQRDIIDDSEIDDIIHKIRKNGMTTFDIKKITEKFKIMTKKRDGPMAVILTWVDDMTIFGLNEHREKIVEDLNKVLILKKVTEEIISDTMIMLDILGLECFFDKKLQKVYICQIRTTLDCDILKHMNKYTAFPFQHNRLDILTAPSEAQMEKEAKKEMAKSLRKGIKYPCKQEVQMALEERMIKEREYIKKFKVGENLSFKQKHKMKGQFTSMDELHKVLIQKVFQKITGWNNYMLKTRIDIIPIQRIVASARNDFYGVAAAELISRYLKVPKALVYRKRKDEEVEAFVAKTDSDFASEKHCRSISGVYVSQYGNNIYSHSRKQDIIACSVMEAEILAGHEGSKKLSELEYLCDSIDLFIKLMYKKLDFGEKRFKTVQDLIAEGKKGNIYLENKDYEKIEVYIKPISVLITDSESGYKESSNYQPTKRNKHVETKLLRLKQQVFNKDKIQKWVPREENIEADFLTKVLPKHEFDKTIESLGIEKIPSKILEFMEKKKNES